MSTTVYSQVLIYTAESTGTTVERTKMSNLRNGSKGGFEPGLTRLRVRHSTTELPRSTYMYHIYTPCTLCILNIHHLYSTYTTYVTGIWPTSWTPAVCACVCVCACVHPCVCESACTKTCRHIAQRMMNC